MAKSFNKNGYVVIDLNLSKNYLNHVIKDILQLEIKSDTKKNPEIYHYNESPRIVEGYKKSKFIKGLCLNKKIISLLNYFYEKKPVPINSINFIKGTNQPLHSDYIHFSSNPHKYLAAAWIALEKTDARTDAGIRRRVYRALHGPARRQFQSTAEDHNPGNPRTFDDDHLLT